MSENNIISEIDKNIDIIISDDILEENGEELIQWLKLNSEPWINVEQKCVRTTNFRNQDLKTAVEFSEILKKWPLYKHPTGYALIEIDFTSLYDGKETLLYHKWSKFVEKVKPLAQDKIKDEKIKELLKKITEKSFENEEAINTIIGLVLHSLLVPTRKTYVYDTNLKKKRLIKSSVRYSEKPFFSEKSYVF